MLDLHFRAIAVIIAGQSSLISFAHREKGNKKEKEEEEDVIGILPSFLQLWRRGWREDVIGREERREGREGGTSLLGVIACFFVSVGITHFWLMEACETFD